MSLSSTDGTAILTALLAGLGVGALVSRWVMPVVLPIVTCAFLALGLPTRGLVEYVTAVGTGGRGGAVALKIAADAVLAVGAFLVIWPKLRTWGYILIGGISAFLVSYHLAVLATGELELLRCAAVAVSHAHFAPHLAVALYGSAMLIAAWRTCTGLRRRHISLERT